MNRILLFILSSALLPLSLSAAPTRCVEAPEFESGSINLRISAVHLSDSATLIDTDIYFKPTQNIEQLGVYLSKVAKLHLKGCLTDSIYPLRSVVGSPFDANSPDADSTHLSATFLFAPLAPADSVFDFIDRSGVYSVRGIDLTYRPHGMLTHISGGVTDYPENSWVYILPRHGDLRFSKSVIVPVRDGEFHYDIFTDAPLAYQIIFGPEGLGASYKNYFFLADGQPVTAHLDRARPYWETIKGSPLNDAYISYRRSLQQALDSIGIKVNRDTIASAIDRTTLQYLNSDTASLAGLAVIHENVTIGHSAVRDSLLTLFGERYAPRFPDHPYAIELAQLLEGEAAGLTAEKGGRYFDFTAPDLNGAVHRLSDLINGRYAVIDLWASWCGSCRRHSIELIPVYEKWKDRGFTVVGVAREYGDTRAMETSIRKDGYPWVNLVALDDAATAIWNRYKAANSGGRILLVSPSGEILAVQPSAAGIDAMLETLIGEK